MTASPQLEIWKCHEVTWDGESTTAGEVGDRDLAAGIAKMSRPTQCLEKARDLRGFVEGSAPLVIRPGAIGVANGSSDCGGIRGASVRVVERSFRIQRASSAWAASSIHWSNKADISRRRFAT